MKDIIYIIVCVVLGYYIYYQHEESVLLEYNQGVLVDSITTYKNKEGQYVATISTFEDSNTDMFLALKTKDQEVIDLQVTVKEYKKKLKEKGSATNVGSETEVDTVFRTTVIVEKDSSITYKSAIPLEPWITGTIVMTKDSTIIGLKVVNKYTVIVGEDKKFLRKGVPYVEVTNKNPYTKTTSLRAYQVALPKPKRIFLGPAVGYGVNGPFVGVVVGYGLLRF